MGDFGSTLPVSPEKDMTTWQAGTEVEVAWGMRYNRARDVPPLLLMMMTCAGDPKAGWARCVCIADGGGYQYRLCSAEEPLTE